MPEHEAYRVIVSKRAAQQLVEHAAFAARLDEKLAHKLVSDFRQAAVSLERFPFRNTPTADGRAPAPAVYLSYPRKFP